jgi:hypothetical protein
VIDQGRGEQSVEMLLCSTAIGAAAVGAVTLVGDFFEVGIVNARGICAAHGRRTAYDVPNAN